MFTRKFWKATAERAIASIAGGALSVIGVDAFGVIEADWVGICSVALGAGVVSVLKALAAGAYDGNPSIGSQETVDEPGRHVAE